MDSVLKGAETARYGLSADPMSCDHVMALNNIYLLLLAKKNKSQGVPHHHMATEYRCSSWNGPR